MQHHLIIMVSMFLVNYTFCITATQIAENRTKTVCENSTSQSCYWRKSSSFCPDRTFFYRINTALQQDGICFYYNTSNELVEQVTLSSSQKSRIVAASALQTPITSNVTIYSSYSYGMTIKIGGQQNMSFRNSNGQCLDSGQDAFTFQIKFGLNMKLTCKDSNGINKAVQKFYDGSQNVDIPQLSSTSTSVTLYFFIGTYSSTRIKYIQTITSEQQVTQTDLRTLQIEFISLTNTLIQQQQPSLFPQIPQDIFYPIFMRTNLN